MALDKKKLNKMTDALVDAVLKPTDQYKNKLPYTQNPVGIIKELLFTNETLVTDYNYYRYIVTINGQDYKLQMNGTKYNIGDKVPLKAENNNWDKLKLDDVAQKIGKVHIIPEPSKDYYDEVFLYLGETNDKYTQYHNYHCIRNLEDNTYSWVDITVFSEGGEWSPPSDWLTLPKPKEHQATFLVDNSEITFIRATGNGSFVCTVQWGDGNSNILHSYEGIYHDYSNSEGHFTKHGVQQFIITVTTGIDESGQDNLITFYDNEYNSDNSNLLMADLSGLNNTSIPDAMFSGCSCVKRVILPNSVTSIGTYAFGYCYAITSITIPNSVTSIGNGAFQNCSSLTSITIPSGLTSIGDYAFSNCYALTSITIPGVTRIGESAFYSCLSLYEIITSGQHITLGRYAISGCYNLHYNPFVA